MNNKPNDTNRFAHTSWNSNDPIVFAPKYRGKEFYGENRAEIGRILRKRCNWNKLQAIEAEVCPDQIQMLVEIPPKMSVSSFVGIHKGKGNFILFEWHTSLTYKYGNRQFWRRGYNVETAGKNAKRRVDPKQT